MIYVMSDLHGRYKGFKNMLQKINFSEKDKMYILGDVLDRGENPISLLQYIMNHKNIHLLLGNHELYAILLLKYFTVDLNQYNYELFVEKNEKKYMQEWMYNGNQSTINQYSRLGSKEKVEIIKYLKNTQYSESVRINKTEYKLAHSYMPALYDSPIYSYEINLKNMERVDYSKNYTDKAIFVSGHTPTSCIAPQYEEKIYINNYHINLDCGFEVLGCLCLDTCMEYYIKNI